MHGRSVVHKIAKDKRQVDLLRMQGVKFCESDLGEVTKFLHDEYDEVSEELCTDASKFRTCFYDIETQTSCPQDRNSIVKVKRISDNVELTGVLNELDDFTHTNDYLWWDEDKQAYVKFMDSCFFVSEFPKPSEAKYPVNVLTAWSSVDKQTHTWGLFPYTGKSEAVVNYRYFKDEYAMFTDFVKWVASQKFDIFTGWNSDGFDLEYIITRIRRLEDERGISTVHQNVHGEQVKTYKLTRMLSPLNKEPTVRNIVDKKGNKTGTAISVPGLYTCDYMDMYKKFIWLKFPSYSLNYVCDKVLGEGKLEYEGQIYEIYKRDWNRYVEYNVQDVVLLVKLDAKKQVLAVAIPYCIDCMITLDKYNSMIAAVEGYILKFLHHRSIRLNDIDHSKQIDWWRNEEYYKVKDKDR